MKQNETSKPCRDHEIDRAFGSRDTSRVAIQPEDGIVALAECAAGSKVDPTMARVDLNKRHVRDLAPVSGETNGARHNKRVLPLLN